jgi:KaiC/GvpD/RAD55 family RecA-like ATPase
MYADLAAVLEQFTPPQAEFLFIKDSAATCEGTLLLHHFISSYLQCGGAVCLVAFEETFEHYSHVVRRLGSNLDEEEAAGKFKFIDGFRKPYVSGQTSVCLGVSDAAIAAHNRDDEETSCTSTSGTAFPCKTRESFSIVTDKNLSDSVQDLFNRILCSVRDLRCRFEMSPVCIIIDSLSTFLDCKNTNTKDGNNAVSFLFN